MILLHFVQKFTMKIHNGVSLSSPQQSPYQLDITLPIIYEPVTRIGEL